MDLFYKWKSAITRFYLRSGVVTGVLLTIYGIVLTGCVAIVPIVPEVPKTISNLEDAELALRANSIETYGRIWEEESVELGDSYSAGISAWKLANVTMDSAWSNAAINSFEKDLRNNSFNVALTTAWLGSAHALQARDFPIQGWWQVIPGPGFVRLYHVQRSFSLLNEAVKKDPFNPIIRLIRGSTLLGIPSIFGGYKKGISDFETIEEWISNPKLNTEYANLIESQPWLQEYYLSCAKTNFDDEDNKKNTDCLQKLYDITQEPVLKEYAKWKLN